MTTALQTPVRRAWTGLKPRRVRTYREFAEQEIVLSSPSPSGRRHFACDFMPWAGLILDAFERGRYRRWFGTGSVQSGKTLLFGVVPVMYHLFEIGETVIFGAPDVAMAQGIFDEKIRPSIERSRYKDLLPTKGGGSRGGKTLELQFRHGPMLRFMGGGGGASQRASHTARIAVITEINKAHRERIDSAEPDWVTEIEARTTAFGARARIYAECTHTDSQGRVNVEVAKFGSDHHIYVPCPHCGMWIAFEREYFIGWKGAADVMTARQDAAYACQECGAMWTEADRAAALRTPVLAARGQTVDRTGRVRGEPPATTTFGLSWNHMYSPMVAMGDIAEKEYRAEQGDSISLTREVYQLTWGLPYDELTEDLSRMSRDTILGKISKYPRGMAPPKTVRLTVFVDLGLRWCWWTAFAWLADAQGHCIDYGAIEIPQPRKATPRIILSNLQDFRDAVLRHGWTVEGTERTLVPDLVLIDSGWEKEIAYALALESGEQYYPARGLGTARNQMAWRAPKPAKNRIIGREWFMTIQPPSRVRLVNFHADHWKRVVHQGWAAAPATPGSLHLYKAEPSDHAAFARQTMAEREILGFVPGIGERTVWDRRYRDNHYFDCAVGCRVAAEMLGVGAESEGQGRPTRKSKPKAQERKRWIRATY